MPRSRSATAASSTSSCGLLSLAQEPLPVVSHWLPPQIQAWTFAIRQQVLNFCGRPTARRLPDRPTARPPNRPTARLWLGFGAGAGNLAVRPVAALPPAAATPRKCWKTWLRTVSRSLVEICSPGVSTWEVSRAEQKLPAPSMVFRTGKFALTDGRGAAAVPIRRCRGKQGLVMPKDQRSSSISCPHRQCWMLAAMVIRTPAVYGRRTFFKGAP